MTEDPDWFCLEFELRRNDLIVVTISSARVARKSFKGRLDGLWERLHRQRSMEVFDAAQLQRAIKELKDSTRVTMETVGVRFCRRVSTALYREHLLRSPGTRDAAL